MIRHLAVTLWNWFKEQAHEKYDKASWEVGIQAAFQVSVCSSVSLLFGAGEILTP